MRLTLTTFLSIDGVMQSPGAREEDPSDGFELGGWLVPFAADMAEVPAFLEWFGRADAFLLGRRTWQIFRAFWPSVTDPADLVAKQLNALPKHVVTSTLTELDWSGSTALTGDLRIAVEQLKAQPGDELQVHGSGMLARSLHDLGLIDEYRLWTFPVVLGTGQRLFGEGSAPTTFEQVDSTTTSHGVVVRTLRPSGGLRQGTLGLEAGREVVVDDGSA